MIGIVRIIGRISGLPLPLRRIATSQPRVLLPRSAGIAEPDLEDIFAEQPPIWLRGPHYVIAALLLLLVLIAMVAKVDMIVTATGRLVPDSPPIVLQPLERSVIRELRVKVGDLVKQGDVLAKLDPTFTQADRAALVTQQEALQAQIRRLEAELSSVPLTAEDGTPDELLQLALYRQRQSQYASRINALDEEIKRNLAAIQGNEDSRGLLSQQLIVAREIENMRAELYQDKTGSKLNYLDARVARMREERDHQDLMSKSTELEHTLQSARASRQVFVDQWQGEVLENLAKARADVSGVMESLAKATRLNDLVVLSAPQDGIVLDVAKRSVGSVLHEGEPLVTMVSSDTPLIVEVMIDSADVGYTKAGDTVEVKVAAFRTSVTAR